MARKLENSEDAKDAQRDERAANVFVVRDYEADVVGEDGDHVDDAHHRPDKLAPIRSGEKTQTVLDGEYHNARRVQAEKDLMIFFAQRQRLGITRLAAGRQSVDYIGKDRHGDEETGDVIKNQSRGACVGVLKRSPHALPEGGGVGGDEFSCRRDESSSAAVGDVIIIANSFLVFAVSVAVVLVTTVGDHFGHDAEKFQLVVDRGNALRAREVHFARAIITQDVSEDFRIAVEEVLVSFLVVKVLLFRAAQQRFWKLLERAPPHLETSTADVERHDLVFFSATTQRNRRQVLSGHRCPACKQKQQSAIYANMSAWHQECRKR